MRSLGRALLWASAAGFLINCSVNQAGLTDDGAVQTGTGGASAPAGLGGNGANAGTAGNGIAGNVGSTGSGGAAGVVVTGTAGKGGSGGNTTAGVAGTTGAAASGGAGSGATTGSAGVSGAAGSSGDAGGTVGGGGVGGAGNVAGAGVAGNMGSGGAGNVAGTIGSGGAGNAAGTNGTGGVAGTIGGRGGVTGGGRGGGAGVGGTGRGGSTGRGGTGGNPCAGYPSGAKAFVTPTDGRTHCYWSRSSSQTWSEAQQSCTLQNGHLVTILSAEENAFVVSVAQFSSSFDDTWIGATDGRTGGDKTGAGTYRWVTAETWGYSSWAQGQPDGFCDPCSLGQSCTCDHRAVLASDGTWNDRWQDNMRSSVCEATPN
jgi:hypothetical protein